MPTETIIECEHWDGFGLDGLAELACAATLRHLGLDSGEHEIVVLGADDTRIAGLNGQFRGKAVPTNVLSWPSEERAAATPGARPEAPGAFELGDIALAWETCTAEALQLGRGVHDHVTHLLVHGTLHLLGYDHETEADAQLMEATEVAILADLGLADPYGV